MRDGLGAVANPTQAMMWLQRAAEAGHVLAQVALGFCYLAGDNLM